MKKYYVVQTARGIWKQDTKHIWGEGHKHRLIIEAESGAAAIRKAKKQIRR